MNPSLRNSKSAISLESLKPGWKPDLLKAIRSLPSIMLLPRSRLIPIKILKVSLLTINSMMQKLLVNSVRKETLISQSSLTRDNGASVMKNSLWSQIKMPSLDYKLDILSKDNLKNSGLVSSLLIIHTENKSSNRSSKVLYLRVKKSNKSPPQWKPSWMQISLNISSPSWKRLFSTTTNSANTRNSRTCLSSQLSRVTRLKSWTTSTDWITMMALKLPRSH